MGKYSLNNEYNNEHQSSTLSLSRKKVKTNKYHDRHLSLPALDNIITQRELLSSARQEAAAYEGYTNKLNAPATKMISNEDVYQLNSTSAIDWMEIDPIQSLNAMTFVSWHDEFELKVLVKTKLN